MTLSTRLALAMSALVLFTAAAVGLLAYRDLASSVLPSALERLEFSVQLRANQIDAQLQQARADMFGLREDAALAGLVRAQQAGGIAPAGLTNSEQWGQMLARRFTAE